MIKYLIIIGLLILSGCASVIKPNNEMRITEYGAAGQSLLKEGAIGGCRAVQEGNISGQLIYSGDKCHFESIPTKRIK